MSIKSLQIGQLHFASNLIQGPLAGYSCAPFRKLFSQFLAPAYSVTEMISAQDLIHRGNKKSRYLYRDPVEKYLCYQLAGHSPQVLKEATAMVSDLGADLIDLNCGCPKPKIRQKKSGSYLLSTPYHIAKIVEAMKSATQKPVTVKIRVDGNSPHDKNHLAVAKAIEQAGADALIVHGRHWQEDYDVACHLEQIAEIVAEVKIPVIGNGDVFDFQSLQTLFLKTQCAGVMISRAGTGKPWLYQQLMQESAGEIYHPPNLNSIIEIFFSHVGELANLENDRSAILQARKFLKYYFRNYVSQQQLIEFYAINNIKILADWLRAVFPSNLL